MNNACRQLEPLLVSAAAGDLDTLTPEQVAALEAHVNACPSCAARLAGQVPQPDARMTPPVVLPSEEQWDRVWEEIETGTGTAGGHSSPSVGLLRRLWQPLVAAAACVLLVVVWRSATPMARQPWDLELSNNVVVHEIETFGDVTPLVVYSSDDGAAVIWMLENEGA
jgi:hypothetical protein